MRALEFLSPVIYTIFYSNHFLLSHIIIVYTMVSSERGMNPVAMVSSILEKKKIYIYSGRAISCSRFLQLRDLSPGPIRFIPIRSCVTFQFTYIFEKKVGEFFPSHLLLSHIVIVEKMGSVERGMNSVEMISTISGKKLDGRISYSRVLNANNKAHRSSACRHTNTLIQIRNRLLCQYHNS